MWEAGKFVILFLARVCEMPAEDQLLHEDDLVDEPAPNGPVSGVGGSTDPAPGCLEFHARFDSGDPQAVEAAAVRLLEQGQGFVLRYVDDELYVGPASSEGKRETERLRAGAVQIAEPASSSNEPALRHHRGLPVHAPEPDNEPETPAEERRGLAVTPFRVGGNFTTVRDDGGRWIASYEEVAVEAVEQPACSPNHPSL